jgi:hypothetical protein
MTGGKTRGTAAIVAVLLAGLVLVGCGGAADSGADGVAEEPARTGSGQQEGPGGATGDRAGALKVGVPARAVIHTGRLELRVKDVADAADSAIRIAEEVEGYVGKDSRDLSDGSGESARAVLTLRIPAVSFQTGIRRLAALGTELEREITAEDVSEAMVDLDTRIATMRASVKRTRALLNQAQSLSDISTVERELSTREAELASLESRRRNLGNQVTYSNITITFVTPQTAATPTGPKIGFGAGLAAGWDAFTMSVNVLLTILGAILPFLMYGVPVLALILLLRRLSRRPRPLPATAGLATPGPARSGTGTGPHPES